MRVTSPRILACLLVAIAFLLVPASPASACSSCTSDEGYECTYSLFFQCTVLHFTEPPRCFNMFCGEFTFNRTRGTSTIHEANGSNRANAQCAPAALMASNLSLGPRQLKIIHLSQLRART
jgi:hypothetical protein